MKRYFLSVVFLLAAIIMFSQQPGKSDLEKQRAAIQKEINDVKRSLDETKRNKKTSLAQLNAVQRKLQLRQRQIAVINQQMGLIENDISQSWRDVTKLKKELDTLKYQYENSVVYSYKNRTNYDFLNFIFSAANFNDALKRVAYLKSYRAYREQQANTIVRTQTQLEEKISDLNANRTQKSLVLKEEGKAKQVLEEEKKEKDVVITKLKTREKELQKEFADKKKQDIKLSSAITAAINRAKAAAMAEARKNAEAKRNAEIAAAAATAKNNDPATNTATNNTVVPKKVASVEKKTATMSVFDSDPAIKKLSDDFIKNMGSLPWPLDGGRVSMRFGPQIIQGTSLHYYNNGLTFETEAGKAVKAVFDGEVSVITNIGSVQAVIIRHGKYFTTYSNLSSVNVSKGQQVKTGQVIGKIAEKDDNLGELEFLISNDTNKYFDPEKWLR